MRTLRDVIADAYEMRAALEVKRRRMQELAAALEGAGNRFAAGMASTEIADFGRLIEIASDMIAYLESNVRDPEKGQPN